MDKKDRSIEQIDPGLFKVKTHKFVAFYLLKENDSWIAFDTGINDDGLADELRSVEVDPLKVSHIFLTHTDRDHIGNISLFPNAKVYLSKAELVMLDGSTPRFPGRFNGPLKGEYQTLSDGEVIDVGKTMVQAISTPGHTPGSMAYLVNGSILFSGDTVAWGLGGIITRKFNMDRKTRELSLKKLAKLDNISLICTAHTGISRDFAKVMRKWR